MEPLLKNNSSIKAVIWRLARQAINKFLMWHSIATYVIVRKTIIARLFWQLQKKGHTARPVSTGYLLCCCTLNFTRVECSTNASICIVTYSTFPSSRGCFIVAKMIYWHSLCKAEWNTIKRRPDDDGRCCWLMVETVEQQHLLAHGTTTR